MFYAFILVYLGLFNLNKAVKIGLLRKFYKQIVHGLF